MKQRRRREIDDVIGQSDEISVAVLEAFRQQRPERQRDGEQQPADQQRDAEPQDQRVARNARGSAGTRSDGNGGLRSRSASARTRAANSGGRAMVSFCPSVTARSRIRLAEKSARMVTSGAASGLRLRAAEGAEEIEADDFRVELVRRRAVEIAHAHFFRSQPEAHLRALHEFLRVFARQIEATDAHAFGAVDLGIDETSCCRRNRRRRRSSGCR